jgi:hypothetical protein
MCQCDNQNCGCVPKTFTSSIIYDGLVLACPELAVIKPNCSSLNDFLQLISDMICSGTVGPAGPQGIQGIQGIQGTAGFNGANGAPGLNGTNGTNGTNGVDGVVYEHYGVVAEHSWGLVESAIGGAMTHVIVGATGNYQVHVNLSNYMVNTGVLGVGFLANFLLYVNGIQVLSKFVVAPNETDGTHEKDASLLWRGPIATGQIVEVRTITFAESVINVTSGEILINKEA